MLAYFVMRPYRRWSPKLPPAVTPPPDRWQQGVTATVITLAIWQFLQSLLYPIHISDPMAMSLFARAMAESWDFWSLPRWSPDARGYFYPLTHPQAAVALQAWFTSAPFDEWIQRIPSSWLTGVFWLAVATAAAFRRRSGAALLALALVASTPSTLLGLISNRQESYVFASVAAVVLLRTVSAATPGAAIGVGLLAGIGCGYHNSLLPLIGLVGVMNTLAAPGLRAGLVHGALGVAAAVLLAMPFYIDNRIHTGAWIIPQGLPDMSQVVYNAKIAARDQKRYDFSWTARLSPLLLDQPRAGLAVAGLLTGLAATAALRRYRAPQRRDWALAAAAMGFVLLIVDPGDAVYRLTGKRYYTHYRYTRTVDPLAAVAAARLWATTPIFPAIAAGALGTALWRSHRHLAIDAKFPQPEELCLLCSDMTKRLRSGGIAAAHVRALTWLKQQNRPYCLLLRKAEYFALSDLSGMSVQHPDARAILAATTAAEVRNRFRMLGINCVYAMPHTEFDREMRKRAQGLFALRDEPDTVVHEFGAVEVWWLGSIPD